MQETKIIRAVFIRRIQRKGKKLFKIIPHYSCYEDGNKYCTTARNFIQRHNYQPPCIITVLKYTGKDAKFFYSNVGLFDYKYALVNYREFCKKLANK